MIDKFQSNNMPPDEIINQLEFVKSKLPDQYKSWDVFNAINIAEECVKESKCLKKLEPMCVQRETVGNACIISCPKCKHCEVLRDGDELLDYLNKTRYCRWCGQAINLKEEISDESKSEECGSN